MSEYDYIIINDDLDEAAEVLISVAKAARLKVPTLEINAFVQKWEAQ
jgi:guanylate kinase